MTRIRDARQPDVSFECGGIITGAGGGLARSLFPSQLDFAAFESQFLDPDSAPEQSARYLPHLGELLDLNKPSNSDVWAAFKQLPEEQQAKLALEIFYLVLRDAGRDRN